MRNAATFAAACTFYSLSLNLFSASPLTLAGLRGIVTDAKPLLADVEVIHEMHLKGLLVFTYGADKYVAEHLNFVPDLSTSNVPEKVDIQRREGVDAVISDKVTKVSPPNFFLISLSSLFP